MKAVTRFVLRLALLAGLAFSGFWIYRQYGAFAVVVSGTVMAFGLWIAAINAAQRTAIVLANAAGGQRVICPGLNLMIPGFEWVDVVVDITPLEIYLTAHPDTRKNNEVTVELVIGGNPSIRYLPVWARWLKGGSDPKRAIKAWCESTLTELVHYYSKRGEIYRDKQVIARLLVARYLTGASDGGSLESRYGFELEYINVVDVVMPEVLREKELLRESAVEEGKALAVSVSRAIKEAAKIRRKNQTISEKQAFDYVMMDKGRGVSKVIYEGEAGSDLFQALKDIFKN